MTRYAPGPLPAPALPESDPFEAETAALAVLASLYAEGPATARDLLRRISRSLEIAGETTLPFKHAALYAVLHELDFEGDVVSSAAARGPRKAYELTMRGRTRLTEGRERWRRAHLAIRAAAATREGTPR